MTELATVAIESGVHTITMDDGKANALSHDMLEVLETFFDAAEADEAIIVLRGRPGIFSGGFDLKIMMSGFDAAKTLTDRGSRFARRILASPCPVIAVTDGHAIAMGAFTLLASDYRIGTDGAFKIGLNETAIGIPMHQFGIEMARSRLSRRHFNRCVMNAEMFAPRDAIDAGFVDQVVAAAEIDAAIAGAVTHFQSIKLPAFKLTKPKARAGLLAIIDDAIEADLTSQSPF